jgi:hypothetical protein
MRSFIEKLRRECVPARLHAERGRGQAREAPDQRTPIRAPLAVAGRAATGPGAERVPEDALLGRVRRLASRAHRGRGRRDEGALRVRLRRLPPTAPSRATTVPLSGGTRRSSSQHTNSCSTSTVRPVHDTAAPRRHLLEPVTALRPSSRVGPSGAACGAVRRHRLPLCRCRVLGNPERVLRWGDRNSCDLVVPLRRRLFSVRHSREFRRPPSPSHLPGHARDAIGPRATPCRPKVWP